MKLSTFENEVIDTLKQKVAADPEFIGIPVKNPPSIDPETYLLDHSKGEFLVLIGALNFTNKEVKFLLLKLRIIQWKCGPW